MKTTNKKSIGPRIHPRTFEFFSETFRNATAGATILIESFQNLYTATLEDALSLFSSTQKTEIINAIHNIDLNPALLGKHLVYLPLPVDINHVLQDLPLFSKSCLEIWAKRYWEQSDLSIAAYIAGDDKTT